MVDITKEAQKKEIEEKESNSEKFKIEDDIYSEIEETREFGDQKVILLFYYFKPGVTDTKDSYLYLPTL